MKIPKKLRFGGYDWKIVFDKKKDGGSFDWKTHVITLDDSYGEQEAILLHELMEAILVELQFRFYPQEKSMEYQFHFDHSGLVKLHKALYQVLKDNKLI